MLWDKSGGGEVTERARRGRRLPPNPICGHANEDSFLPSEVHAPTQCTIRYVLECVP